MNRSQESRTFDSALRPWPFGPPLTGTGSALGRRSPGCLPSRTTSLRKADTPPGIGPRWGPRLTGRETSEF